MTIPTRCARASRWLLAALLGSVLACSAEIPDAPSAGGEGAVEAPAAEARKPAPVFTLSDLAGNQVSLASFRGQIVLIDFWATWCAPCIFQIPVLNEFYARHKEDGVVVLGVSIDVDGEEVIPPFIEENPIHYPVLLGDEDLARRYGAPGFPALVVVDQGGGISDLHVGLVEAEELEEVVQKLRGEGPAST